MNVQNILILGLLAIELCLCIWVAVRGASALHVLFLGKGNVKSMAGPKAFGLQIIAGIASTAVFASMVHYVMLMCAA